MDLGKNSEKLEAMKNQKKGYFLSYLNLMLYSVTGLACSLFFYYPCWFSSMSCSVKQFLFIYFPSIWSSCCNPKWLFIIANVIIVFLVGESNFVGSSSANSSPAGDFYDEYVERSRRLRGAAPTFPEKKEEKKSDEQSVNTRGDEVKDVIRIETEKNNDGEEVEKERDGEEDSGLPAEELSKRVEEFIARVNKQRWLEARSLVCCRT